jgi:hypothetical protein
MSPKSALTIRVLANRFHKASLESLLHFLPEGELEEVRKQEINSPDFFPLLRSPIDQISHIHYSWLTPLIQKLPSKTQAPVIRALPLTQAKRLSHLLGLSLRSETLAPLAQHYILNHILKQLPGFSEVLPLSYLPETSLSALRNLSKTSLVDLIRFLGIHDLAEEIRHVVDKKRIKIIYECLTSPEQQYLKYCMHLKEKFIAPSLGLDKWGGDCDKLKTTLQARGLIRLGKALSGEHPDFVWHLAHILDTSRGQSLSKYYSKKAIPNITPALAQQVTNLIGILKKKGAA